METDLRLIVMTAWGTITLKIDKTQCVYDKYVPPTGITIDSGFDEQGWVDEDRYYALSNGRYQSRRLEGHAEDMYCPKFSGVTLAFIADVENTGDNVKVGVYRPKQRRHGKRKDGYEKIEEIEGKRWPEDERDSFKRRVERQFGMKPVIEPQETITPPDAIIRRKEK